LITLFLGLACLLVGCADAIPADRPYVWIDAPTDGLRVPPDQPVQIEGHATYREGIARVEIWVNGEIHLVEENLPADGNLTRFDQSWMPPGPGDYVVQVVAIGADGTGSDSDFARLHVGDAVAEIEPTPTATPEEIESPSTAAPTAPPPTAVFTIPPPPTAEPTVPPPPTAEPTVPPPPTNTPTPHDTTAPPAPVPLKPTDGAEIDPYATTVLRWSPVSDPSGIAEYRVQVERPDSSGDWQPLESSPWRGLTAPEFELEIESGWTYRWRVRAVDKAGNKGPFSAWFEFSVKLT
jgi:hypothetical protein